MKLRFHLLGDGYSWFATRTVEPERSMGQLASERDAAIRAWLEAALKRLREDP